MPVRIYDISKKLGLENKEVLAKAKALGIAARVASSSLDKITAEYLEQQIVLEHPNLAQPAVAPSATAPSAPNEPVVIIAPPPAESETLQREELQTATATAVLEPEPSSAPSGLMQAEAPAEPEVEQQL